METFEKMGASEKTELEIVSQSQPNTCYVYQKMQTSPDDIEHETQTSEFHSV